MKPNENVLVLQYEDGEIIGVFSNKKSIKDYLIRDSNLTSKQISSLLEDGTVKLEKFKTITINDFKLDDGDCFLYEDDEIEEEEYNIDSFIENFEDDLEDDRW